MSSRNKWSCSECSYTTNRKYNLELHISRKSACAMRQKVDDVNKNVNLDDKNVNLYDKNVNLDDKNVNLYDKNVNLINKCLKCSKTFTTKSYLVKHENKCLGNESLKCNKCKKIFASRQSKYKHIKNVKCKPLEERSNLEEELERLKKENEILKSNKPITINNNIQINNYDNPYIDHMSKHVIKRMYYKSKQDVHMMILESIRTIKSIPENDNIHLIEGSKSKFAQVKKDNEILILPLIEVLETLLTKSSEVCGDGLRECTSDGLIKGNRCVIVQSILDNLATDDRDGDKDNRAPYLPYVKSSLL